MHTNVFILLFFKRVKMHNYHQKMIYTNEYIFFFNTNALTKSKKIYKIH